MTLAQVLCAGPETGAGSDHLNRREKEAMTITISIFDDTPEALLDPDAVPLEVRTFDSQEAAAEFLEEQPYPLIMSVDIS